MSLDAPGDAALNVLHPAAAHLVPDRRFDSVLARGERPEGACAATARTAQAEPPKGALADLAVEVARAHAVADYAGIRLARVLGVSGSPQPPTSGPPQSDAPNLRELTGGLTYALNRLLAVLDCVDL